MLLEVFIKRFTGDRNPSPNERPVLLQKSWCKARTGSTDGRLDFILKRRFTGSKNNVYIGLHYLTVKGTSVSYSFFFVNE